LEGRTLLSTILALTSQDDLITFDSATPSTISGTLPIIGLPLGETIVAIDLQPATGQVFGLGSESHLYTISLISGAATAVSPTAFSTALIGDLFSMDDNPVTGQIRVVDDSDQNFRLDPTTATVAATDPPPNYASGDPNFGHVPGLAGFAYTNNAAGATSTTAYALDAETDTLDLMGSPGGSPTSPNTGLLTTVGSLGVAFNDTPGDSYGFDVVGATTTAYAVLTPTSGTNTGKTVLYSINLSTGAATSLGLVGDGSTTIIGVAASTLNPPPAPSFVGSSSHITNISTPTFTGTAIPGAMVWIFANGNLAGTGTANSSGTYTITTAKLADGSYTIQALQFNASGLPSGLSAAMTPPLVIATVTPAPPSAPELLAADDTGFSDTDHYTRNNAPEFIGTGEPGATVFVFANFALVGTATIDSSGDYSVQAGAMPDGTYQVVASQVDAAGNVSSLSGPMAPLLVIDTSSRPLPQEAYINALYQDLFGLPADAVGLTYWTAVLATSGRGVVVGDLLASNFYFDKVARGAYTALLGRMPTPTELFAAQRSLSVERIELFEAQIAGTNEYYVDAGSTIPGFLARLGQDILGQPIDPTSLATYTAQLKAGATRTSVAFEVLTSPAGLTATINQTYASLHMTPDPALIPSLVVFAQHGGTVQQLTAVLAMSNNFFASVQNDATILQWANQVYFDLFDVEPDAASAGSLATALEQGIITPLQAVQALQSTTLYRQVEVTRVYDLVLDHAPDPAGLAAATSFLASGGTIETLEAILMSTADFFQHQGGGTNAGALAAMYKIAAGTPIPTAALTIYEAQLAAGISFTQISGSLLYSTTGAANTIQLLYQSYVRQPATFSDVAALTGPVINGAAPIPLIVAALVTTDAYFAGL
jgi:hypothetical protein